MVAPAITPVLLCGVGVGVDVAEVLFEVAEGVDDALEVAGVGDTDEEVAFAKVTLPLSMKKP